MIEPLFSADAGTQKRRSTRIVQAVPVTVTGVDALGQPFKERTTTVMVNCHGCKYQSKHYVPKNSTITLEIPRVEPGLPPRTALGRVVWVQRPRTVRELFQIGLEFEVAGNVWGIAFPPEDWFPCADDPAAPAPAQPEESLKPQGEAPAAPHLPQATQEVSPTQSDATEAFAPASPEADAPAPPADSKIRVMAGPPHAPETHLATPQQMAHIVAEAKEALDKSLRRDAQSAINDEMAVVRQRLDSQLHEAVERAIKLSMERVSESAVKKVVQQATERTAAIVEEARHAGEVSAGQLDAKVRQAVQQAAGQAAEQAAQQAAQQAAAHNVKQIVDAAVERAIAQRRSSPELEIIASPEAAQQHLDEWKKSLEQAARTLREQAIEKNQADAADARKRWVEEFEAVLGGASRKVAEEVNAAAQDAASSARAGLESLGAMLDQERARAEQISRQIRQSADETLGQASSRLEELASRQAEEVARRTSQLAAEQLRAIEPMMQSSAQSSVERLSKELDRHLDSRLAEARNAAAELARAGEQAAEAQSRIREQAAQLEASAREQLQEAARQALQDSLSRMREDAAKLPAEAEQAIRGTISKAEEELEQKSTEAQHSTFEALSKAADWYQKKAQTTMQSTMEKTLEQSSSVLRSRAAEISSLVASELDHYGRSYVEHSRAQIEEAAKEVTNREKAQLGEAGKMASAGFTDHVRQVSSESLSRFEEASRQALEKARSDMEYNREASLAEFQKKLDDQMVQGAEQARTYLQSQFVPLMEEWDARRLAQQREWMQRLEKSMEESIEQYKARLENASNSWLLASATTLGQHSQVVLDTLAKSAEKRIREACADVLAGMGDSIKARLKGISGQISSEDEDDAPKK